MPVATTTQSHGPTGEKLRETMHKIAENTFNSPTSQLPSDPESPKTPDTAVFEQAATLAAGLADAAGEIPARARDRELSAANREIFNAEAATLQSQARELQQAANEHKVEQMQRSFDRINSTCIACHSRFREFTGDIGIPKAARDVAEQIDGVFAAVPR
jgi:cytochrome c556